MYIINGPIGYFSPGPDMVSASSKDPPLPLPFLWAVCIHMLCAPQVPSKAAGMDAVSCLSEWYILL